MEYIKIRYDINKRKHSMKIKPSRKKTSLRSMNFINY